MHGSWPNKAWSSGAGERSLRRARISLTSERPWFIPAMHVWQKTLTALNSDEVLNLFKDAIELRPPDQRTGLWQ
jgi:hypothetical protein